MRVSALATLCAIASCNAAGVHDPLSSVTALINRRLGVAYVPAFNFSIIALDASGNDVFELDRTPDGRVAIRGNSGVSLAAGLGWYLKYYCNASWTWGREGTGWQLGTVPQPSSLPLPPSVERTVSPVRYRYAYNVCTFGYTMPWWNWPQWEEELDRLALW